MSGVGTYRRYCLLKAEATVRPEEEGLYLAWLAKQQATPGTPLPPDFPSAEKLDSLGYTTIEDLWSGDPGTSADIEELVRKGLSSKEAAAVITAASQL